MDFRTAEDERTLVHYEEVQDHIDLAVEEDISAAIHPNDLSDSLPNSRDIQNNSCVLAGSLPDGRDIHNNSCVLSGSLPDGRDIHNNSCVLSGSLPHGHDIQHMTRDEAKTPVYYSTEHGVQLMATSVVSTMEDGTSVIRTPRPEDDQPDRPLRPKDVRCILIFSIVSVVLFFPAGIAALILALQAKHAFSEGLITGNMDTAKRRAKQCEKLILLSIILGILGYAFVFALVERKKNNNHDHKISLHWLH